MIKRKMMRILCLLVFVGVTRGDCTSSVALLPDDIDLKNMKASNYVREAAGVAQSAEICRQGFVEIADCLLGIHANLQRIDPRGVTATIMGECKALEDLSKAINASTECFSWMRIAVAKMCDLEKQPNLWITTNYLVNARVVSPLYRDTIVSWENFVMNLDLVQGPRRLEIVLPIMIALSLNVSVRGIMI